MEMLMMEKLSREFPEKELSIKSSLELDSRVIEVLPGACKFHT